MAAQSPLALQLVDGIAPILATLLTAFFGWVAAKIAAKVKGETLRTSALRVAELAQIVVLDVEQTFVSKMRDAAKDGVLDEQDAREAKELAVEKLRQHLGPKGKKEALKVFGFDDEKEFDDFLRTNIEASVAKAKNIVGRKFSELALASTASTPKVSER